MASQPCARSCSLSRGQACCGPYRLKLAAAGGTTRASHRSAALRCASLSVLMQGEDLFPGCLSLKCIVMLDLCCQAGEERKDLVSCLAAEIKHHDVLQAQAS